VTVHTGMAPSLVDERAIVSLQWLVRLRWWAVGLALLLVAVSEIVFAAGLRLPPILGLLGIAALTNAMLALRSAERSAARVRLWCGAALLIDALVLTLLLRLTGGPSNPFSVLYLVHITLAAVTLGPAWTASLALLSIVCYGSLFVPLAGTHGQKHGMEDVAFLRHLQAMWFAFTAAAGLTAYFVVRLAAALERRDAELAAAREQATRNERLASLTALAAGAAHELGTPLATIAVVAKELERACEGRSDSGLADDARLIREQVERCRRILDDMASGTGEPVGEAPEPVELAVLAAQVREALDENESGRLDVEHSTAPLRVVVPRRALVRALVCLVRNGLDASEPHQRVRMVLAGQGTALRIEVHDAGRGMSKEVLARAVEPFFSTKPAGKGLGLGLFLVQTLAERMGGRFTLHSEPGAGSVATIELPVREAA